MTTSSASLAERYRYLRACEVVGRGFKCATAFELVLKMKGLTAILPGQLFALHIAHARNYDPDTLRGNQKGTETRKDERTDSNPDRRRSHLVR